MSKIINVFTDGSYIKGKYCGYGIHFPEKELNDVSKKFTHYPLSNQRAELYAIYKAIKKIKNNIKFDRIKIYTDSEYSIKSLTIWIKKWKKNGWKTANNKDVLNTDIIKKIDNYLETLDGKIEFIHVRSHTNKKDYFSLHNDIADKLAKGGV